VAWGQGAGDDLDAVIGYGSAEHVEHRSGRTEQGERVVKDSVLELNVAGSPEGASEREVAPKAARRGGAFDLAAVRAEGNGG
jgi:hypothetical protein